MLRCPEPETLDVAHSTCCSSPQQYEVHHWHDYVWGKRALQRIIEVYANVNIDVLAMLADSVAVFARSDPSRARRLRGGDPPFGIVDWKRIAEQGWLSVLVPESQGGLGLGVSAASVIARELGRAALPEPFVPVAVMAATCLADCDDKSQWAATISALCAGNLIATMAWQDRMGNIDGDACGVTASEAGGETVLEGATRFVPVPSADAFVVSARGADGIGLYWVARNLPGLVLTSEACPDGSALGDLSLNAVRLPRSECIVTSSRASAVLQRSLDVALVANAAELVGVMDTALALTLEYLRNRRQFGVAIGSFQALQHRSVDIWIQRQLAAAAVTAAAAVLDDENSTSSERAIAASGAKARASQATLLLCNEALQLHGAIGFTDEYELGIYLNRGLTLAAWLGGAAEHRRRFGRLAPIGEVGL
jgi:alkylation response protein AidB-like acyl-CoA dehydrogenase